MSATAYGYRSLRYEPTPGWRGVWAIARWNLKLAYRRKLFWVIFLIGMFHFLLHFAKIYIKAQLEIEVADVPWLKKSMDKYLVTQDASAYRDFLQFQSRAIVMMLAYAGVVLVSADYRAGGVPFYLSKPITKHDYVFGKLLALSLIAGMLTLLPGLVLFFEYGVYSAETFDYWLNNLHILGGILGYSLLLMVVPSVALLAVGTICRRSTPLIMSWIGIWLIVPAFAGLLWAVFGRTSDWRSLDPWRNLRVLGDLCFGVINRKDMLSSSTTAYSFFSDVASGVWAGDPNQATLAYALLIVPAAFLGCVALLERKLRAVEVIE